MAPATPPPKPGGLGRFSRTLSFWLIAFLIPIVLIQFAMRSSEAAVEIDTSTYDTQLDADNVAKVTITGGQEITGEFKNRILIKGREVRKFKTRFAIQNNPDDVKRLRDHQVTI